MSHVEVKMCYMTDHSYIKGIFSYQDVCLSKWSKSVNILKINRLKGSADLIRLSAGSDQIS